MAEAAKKLGQSNRPKNEVELGKLRLELLNAGFRGEQAVLIFCGLKFLCLLAGLGISVPLIASRSA